MSSVMPKTPLSLDITIRFYFKLFLYKMFTYCLYWLYEVIYPSYVGIYWVFTYKNVFIKNSNITDSAGWDPPITMSALLSGRVKYLCVHGRHIWHLFTERDMLIIGSYHVSHAMQEWMYHFGSALFIQFLYLFWCNTT